ncbi:hypothetical protein [Paeniclostridium hominis]|uniref:hypothetical protein n=1 Tax=Paeniclostridium hominis TaxID=2764329 RepID=UPI0022E00443|nr:hypothetical protein [Paeniclostridium hominis]
MIEMINKTQEELEKLRKNLIELPGWKEEIKVIDDKINAFNDINYSELGFKSGGKTFTIEDLLAREETKKNGLTAKVLQTEYKLREIEAIIISLDENEQRVIRERYLDNLKESNGFRNIAKRLMFGKSSVQRIHDKAILKIANKREEYIEIA